MSKLNCNVVKDILPLYADDVVSSDTPTLVEEHLESCLACRNDLRSMKGEIIIPVNQKEMDAFKKFKKFWGRKQLWKGIAVSAIIFAVFAGVFFYLYGYGIPVKARDIVLEDGLQCVPELDWNTMTHSVDCPEEEQSWVLDITLKNGALRTSSKMEYALNSNGEEVLSAIRIYLRRTVFTFPWEVGTNDTRTGFSNAGEMPNNQDVKIIIVCQDQEFIYSMREEGVFDTPTEPHSPQFCPWAN